MPISALNVNVVRGGEVIGEIAVASGMPLAPNSMWNPYAASASGNWLMGMAPDTYQCLVFGVNFITPINAYPHQLYVTDVVASGYGWGSHTSGIFLGRSVPNTTGVPPAPNTYRQTYDTFGVNTNVHTLSA